MSHAVAPSGAAASEAFADRVRDLMLTRTTPHEFTPEPVSIELLRGAIEVACAAPNHRMTEPWGFVRVGGQTRAKLFEIARLDKEKDGSSLNEGALAKLRQKVCGPPELLVATQRLHAKPDVRREDYASLACAILNIAHYLWAYGVGAKWGTGALSTLPQTYELLGLDPGSQEIVGFLWIGRAAAPASKPPRRRSVGDVFAELP